LQRDKTLSEQQEEGIEVIHRCGEHLLTLINDILDLSKIEAERVELYPSEFNFHNFLKTIVELFQLRAQQKALRFLYEELSILPTFVFADETRLRQILVNLLGNAFKFTEQGGITFKVGYHYEEIRFQVEDTGIGIDPKEIDNIFLSFQQVGNSNYRMQGTGLGLTITRKLVEMMGGELHVESRLDQGSTFWVTLDLPEVLTPKEHKSIHETMIKYPIGFEGDPKKVLIVDDREDNRSVLNNLLKPLGFDILEAVNGQEAVAQFETYQPDLILMDLVMPIMDGFEATHLIRELPTTKAVIIIAISASAFEFHKQESQQAGCDDFIVKPFRFKELLSCLQTYLKLVWIYESDNVEIDTVTATHHPLTTTQIATLSDLIMMGDFSAILEFSKTLVQTDARHSALDKKIRQLVDPFQKKKLLELIKAYTEGTTE
jgi:CheY-like chemotaxis protein